MPLLGHPGIDAISTCRSDALAVGLAGAPAAVAVAGNGNGNGNGSGNGWGWGWGKNGKLTSSGRSKRLMTANSLAPRRSRTESPANMVEPLEAPS